MKNTINNIVQEELIRSQVRKMVIEELNNYSKNYLTEANKKHRKKIKNEEVFIKTVIQKLQDETLDLAAIAAEVYPNMNDDTRRSYFSKQVRGLRPMTYKAAVSIDNILKNGISK